MCNSLTYTCHVTRPKIDLNAIITITDTIFPIILLTLVYLTV